MPSLSPLSSLAPGVTKVTALSLASFVAIVTQHYCALGQFYKRISLEEGDTWREIYSNIVILKLVVCGVVFPLRIA